MSDSIINLHNKMIELLKVIEAQSHQIKLISTLINAMSDRVKAIEKKINP